MEHFGTWFEADPKGTGFWAWPDEDALLDGMGSGIEEIGQRVYAAPEWGKPSSWGTVDNFGWDSGDPEMRFEDEAVDPDHEEFWVEVAFDSGGSRVFRPDYRGHELMIPSRDKPWPIDFAVGKAVEVFPYPGIYGSYDGQSGTISGDNHPRFDTWTVTMPDGEAIELGGDEMRARK